LRARALLASLLLAGCSLTVDVEDYTFEEDPCGPRPPACTGGRELAFAIRRIDVPAVNAEGRRDGFDLDGTDTAICNRRDQVAPDGRTGIDNELASVIELYEDLTEFDAGAENERQTISGGPIDLIVLGAVDDLANDDCVEVSRRRALLPEGTELADLDADGDGRLDAGLTFDYTTPAERDPVACSVGGTLHARFSSVVAVLPGTTYEATVDRGRMRLDVSGAEGPSEAMIGGSFRIADLERQFPPAVAEFIARRADLDPSSRTANDCRSISFGIVGTLVPATLGVLRPTR
jgi:hypothetical protein